MASSFYDDLLVVQLDPEQRPNRMTCVFRPSGLSEDAALEDLRRLHPEAVVKYAVRQVYNNTGLATGGLTRDDLVGFLSMKVNPLVRFPRRIADRLNEAGQGALLSCVDTAFDVVFTDKFKRAVIRFAEECNTRHENNQNHSSNSQTFTFNINDSIFDSPDIAEAIREAMSNAFLGRERRGGHFGGSTRSGRRTRPHPPGQQPWESVLGVTPSSTPEEIKRAYRRKANNAHPDKGGSNEQMAKINAAFELARQAGSV